MWPSGYGHYIPLQCNVPDATKDKASTQILNTRRPWPKWQIWNTPFGYMRNFWNLFFLHSNSTLFLTWSPLLDTDLSDTDLPDTDLSDTDLWDNDLSDTDPDMKSSVRYGSELVHFRVCQRPFFATSLSDGEYHALLIDNIWTIILYCNEFVHFHVWQRIPCSIHRACWTIILYFFEFVQAKLLLLLDRPYQNNYRAVFHFEPADLSLVLDRPFLGENHLLFNFVPAKVSLLIAMPCHANCLAESVQVCREHSAVRFNGDCLCAPRNDDFRKGKFVVFFRWRQKNV